ncbi:MAG: transketolase, partial [Chitinophagia bacterium]|nr:transketolase [Chitinophagia bacterium]
MASLQETATQIRRDIVRMVHGVQSGHPGGSLGCTDFLTALYFKVMEHNPSFKMDAKNEDVFILSNG